MKFSSATKTLALAAAAACAATVSADLTPFNTTYDLFVADQQLTLGAATDVVVDKHDQWLLDSFAPFVDKFETALKEAAHDGPYYWDLLMDFFDDAAKHDTTYKDLSKKVSSYDQPPMAYAPRSWTDATFAVFKAVLPTDKDKAPTVTGWADKPITWQQLYDSERKAMEALVNTTERDTIRVTARMERLTHKLFTDEFLGRKYSHAWACANKRMRDAYHYGSGVDPRLSCSDVPEIK